MAFSAKHIGWMAKSNAKDERLFSCIIWVLERWEGHGIIVYSTSHSLFQYSRSLHVRPHMLVALAQYHHHRSRKCECGLVSLLSVALAKAHDRMTIALLVDIVYVNYHMMADLDIVYPYRVSQRRTPSQIIISRSLSSMLPTVTSEVSLQCSIINGDDHLWSLWALWTTFIRRLTQLSRIAHKPFDLRPFLVVNATFVFTPHCPEHCEFPGPVAVGLRDGVLGVRPE